MPAKIYEKGGGFVYYENDDFPNITYPHIPKSKFRFNLEDDHVKIWDEHDSAAIFHSVPYADVQDENGTPVGDRDAVCAYLDMMGFNPGSGNGTALTPAQLAAIASVQNKIDHPNPVDATKLYIYDGATETMIEFDPSGISGNIAFYDEDSIAIGLIETYQGGTYLEFIEQGENYFMKVSFIEANDVFSDLQAEIPTLTTINIVDTLNAPELTITSDATDIPAGDYLVSLNAAKTVLTLKRDDEISSSQSWSATDYSAAAQSFTSEPESHYRNTATNAVWTVTDNGEAGLRTFEHSQNAGGVLTINGITWVDAGDTVSSLEIQPAEVITAVRETGGAYKIISRYFHSRAFNINTATATITPRAGDHYRQQTGASTWTLPVLAGSRYKGIFTIENTGTNTADLTLNGNFTDETGIVFNTLVVNPGQVYTFTRETGGTMRIVSIHPQDAANADWTAQAELADTVLINDGTNRVVRTLTGTAGAASLEVDLYSPAFQDADQLEFFRDIIRTTPANITLTGDPAPPPFNSPFSGMILENGSGSNVVTVNPGETIKLRRIGVARWVVVGRSGAATTDIDWAISGQDRVSETFDARYGNGNGVQNFTATFTADTDGYYALRHFGYHPIGTAIIRVGTTAGGDDVFSTQGSLPDRIDTTDTDKTYPVLLEAGTEYFFSTQAGGGAFWSNLGFEIYPISVGPSKRIDSEIDLQLRQWEPLNGIEYLQSNRDGVPTVVLKGLSTGTFGLIRLEDNIPEVNEERSVCIEWYADDTATQTGALRLARSGFATDLILDPASARAYKATATGNRIIDIKNVRSGDLIKTTATFIGQATPYTVWQIFSDYGVSNGYTSSAGAAGSIEIKSVNLNYTGEAEENYFGAFSKEGPSGGVSGQFTTNVNGTAVTYGNLVNATDNGAGLLQLNGGANGNFNSHATTVETIDCGGYIEFVKGVTSDFHTEAFGISNSFVRNTQADNGHLKVVFTQNNHILSDGAGNTLATLPNATGTWRFTRYSDGFVVEVDGNEVYRDPCIPASPSAATATERGNVVSRFPLISSLTNLNLENYADIQAYLEADEENSITFSTDGTETPADLKAITGGSGTTTQMFELGQTSSTTIDDADPLQAGTYSAHRALGIVVIKQISVPQSYRNAITNVLNTWTPFGSAEPIEPLVLQGFEVAKFSRSVAGTNPYYRFQDAEEFGTAAVDTTALHKITLLRNHPDVATTFMIRHQGASNADIFIDPVNGTVSEENNATVVDVIVDTNTISVWFKINNPWTSRRFYYTWGAPGTTTIDQSIVGSNFVIDWKTVGNSINLPIASQSNWSNGDFGVWNSTTNQFEPAVLTEVTGVAVINTLNQLTGTTWLVNTSTSPADATFNWNTNFASYVQEGNKRYYSLRMYFDNDTPITFEVTGAQDVVSISSHGASLGANDFASRMVFVKRDSANVVSINRDDDNNVDMFVEITFTAIMN